MDVERYRSLSQRSATVREVSRPTLVLGSTQRPEDTVRPFAAAEVWQRRGGGGAVLLEPGNPLWVDVWLPRTDPLWHADVGRAMHWVGAWWVAALRSSGVSGCTVHHGAMERDGLGDLVCFASVGPGEVVAGDRKVVGVSQWRGREGALFMCCAYVRWDPAALVRHLRVPGDDGAVTRRLETMATGLADLSSDPALADTVARRLMASLPSWGTTAP